MWSRAGTGGDYSGVGTDLPTLARQKFSSTFCVLFLFRKLTSTVFKVVSIILRKGPEKDFLLRNFLNI